MMKYGEAKIRAIETAQIEKGIVKLTMPPHEQKMQRHEASQYYNKKLFEYWLQHMSDKIPAYRRKRVLNYLLGI